MRTATPPSERLVTPPRTLLDVSGLRYPLVAALAVAAMSGCTYGSDDADSSASDSASSQPTTSAVATSTISKADAMRALRLVLEGDAQCTGAECSTALGWLARADAITASLDDVGLVRDKSTLVVTVDAYRHAHMELRSCIQISDEKPDSNPDRDCRGPILRLERSMAELRDMAT